MRRITRHVSNHVRLPGLAAFLAVLTAVLTHPALTDLVGEKWSSVVIIAAAALQALTKPVKRERE